VTVEEYASRIRAAYARLQVILTERFGLRGTPRCTFDEFGGAFGVSRERIRQLERGAITQLRRAVGPSSIQ